jgi:hypothetical protein
MTDGLLTLAAVVIIGLLLAWLLMKLTRGG